MKKILALVLVLVMVLSLCACGKEAADPAVPTAASTEAPAENDPLNSQIITIFNSLCMLKTNPEFEKYWYTVTDLDHNGLLEVTGAITQGTDNETLAMMYQVKEDLSTLEAVEISLPAGTSLPEIIAGETESHYNPADNSQSYIFYNTSSLEKSGHFQTAEALTLKNKVLSASILGYIDIQQDGDSTKYVFCDANGSELAGGYEAFQTLGTNVFGSTAAKVSLDWFSLKDIYSTERIAKSYSVFAGIEMPSVDPVITPIPVFTPAPTATAAPTPTPTAAPTATPKPTQAPAPVVTKNPTGETVYAGDSCQFVAKADNATGMRWKLVDPNGNVYDANATPYSDRLGVDGINSNCLTLYNIPLGMNGYRAYAEFYGTQTVSSGKAYLEVIERPKATVSASAYSGSTFYDVWNTLYLYSSDGSKINYEIYRYGDTGPYESGTVASGGGINLVGVEGRSIGLEVYATAKGGDKTAYFYYTIESTPAPPYEYDEYGTVVGDNFAEVFISTSSGTHYIPKDACMMGGTGYPAVGDPATVTFRNGEVLIAVINCSGDYYE